MIEYKNIRQINRIYFYLYRIKYIQYKLQTLNSQLQTINSNIYTYDNVGNKLSKQDSVGSHSYTYDNTYQLTQATHPSIPTEVFAYDAVGNRTNSTVDAANKLLQDPNATYQYDNNGNRYIKTQSDGSVVYYSYDYEGRLTRVETQKPNGTSVAVYKYDPLGRRIEKAVTENSVTTTTRYLYDNEDIIAEYDGNGNLITKYIHGIGIDEPLSMEKNGQQYYYHTDGLGSVTQITNSSGTVVQSYQYDSFGNIKSVLDPNFIQPYMFTGREFDPESGLYFLRARELDSKTGTFTQKDPIGFGGGDVNLYRYVGNDPVNYIDPYGLNRIMFGPNIVSKGEYEDGLKALGLGNLPEWLKNSLYKLYIGSEEAAIMPGVGAIETGSSKFTGMAVKEILKFKKGSILNCPLKKGTPGWDKIMDMKWEELVKLAEKNQGIKTILKLLRDRRFDK